MKKSNINLAKFTIILVILIILISISYLFLVTNVELQTQRTLDTIYSTIRMENGGTPASIDITLEFDNLNDYSRLELQSATERVLQGLEHEDVVGSSAIPYLQNKIQVELKEIYPDIQGNISVYITDFKMGYMAEIEKEIEDSDPGNRDAMFKGIFPNITN